MVWIRRLSIPVLAVIIWFGYGWYDDYSTTKKNEIRDKKALALAKIWVASATYRYQPDRYAEYRDSVLQANNLTQFDLIDLTTEGSEMTEERYETALRISDMVDSLTQIEYDSIRERKKRDTINLDNTNDSIKDAQSETHPDSVPGHR